MYGREDQEEVLGPMIAMTKAVEEAPMASDA